MDGSAVGACPWEPAARLCCVVTARGTRDFLFRIRRLGSPEQGRPRQSRRSGALPDTHPHSSNRTLRLHLVLDAELVLDGLDELALLVEALGGDALVVADLAQLLDPQLGEVCVLHVHLLLVPQLAHLRVLLLHARAQPLGIDPSTQAAAHLALHAAGGPQLLVANPHVVAHGLLLALGGIAVLLHDSLNALHRLALRRRDQLVNLANDCPADLAVARVLVLLASGKTNEAGE
mmetsp:Transcript_21479/g.69697  ORF Transcript_21479/g.69697 Transcript_21479/m.69697 type:complete len:233 (+) Transcript_21479:468-1166(+)